MGDAPLSLSQLRCAESAAPMAMLTVTGRMRLRGDLFHPLLQTHIKIEGGPIPIAMIPLRTKLEVCPAAASCAGTNESACYMTNETDESACYMTNKTGVMRLGYAKSKVERGQKQQTSDESVHSPTHPTKSMTTRPARRLPVSFRVEKTSRGCAVTLGIRRNSMEKTCKGWFRV